MDGPTDPQSESKMIVYTFFPMWIAARADQKERLLP